ncbi:MAG: family 16 glycosylhydrolase [Rhodospirillales bacterium]
MIVLGRRDILRGAIAAPALLTSAARAATAPPGYRLTFADEFDDADVGRINEAARGGRAGAPAWRSRYRHDRFTPINGEKQVYVDRAFRGTAERPLGIQPFAVADGVLSIVADRADARSARPYLKNAAYTSGCMTSELTFWQTYGWFEIRARLPIGKGYWPAFWLLPKHRIWPPEIDVMEGSGARPADVHVAAIGAGKGQTAGTWLRGVIEPGAFHTYAVEWTRESIAWSIDGRTVWRRPNFIHEDMYLLINLALGHKDPHFIPDPDGSTPFPGRFEVDHVRVYARDRDAGAP